MYSFNNYLLLSFSSSLAPNHLTFPLGDLRHSVDPNEVHSKLCPTQDSIGMSMYLTPLFLLRFLLL